MHELLENVSKGLNARLQLEKKTAKEQHALQNTHLRNLQHLKTDCEEVIFPLLFNMFNGYSQVRLKLILYFVLLVMLTLQFLLVIFLLAEGIVNKIKN